MMYRLLIVDDEPVIVDGLMQHFHDDEELGLDVCKAYSAQEAMLLVKKTKIDLLISDIRMPGRNGLQLIDDVLFYWPHCRVIILTGYSEFDYVYTAIRKNIDNYILKTEGIEAIVKAVRLAIGKLDEEAKNRDWIEEARRKMTVAQPLWKKEFFEALLSGEQTDDIWSKGRYSGLALSLQREQPVLMLAGKVDDWEGEMTYTQRLDVLDAIQERFASFLPPVFQMESVVYDRSLLVWLLQIDLSSDKFLDAQCNPDWQGAGSYLKGMLEPVQNSCRDTLGLTVSFAICKFAVEWTETGKQLGQLRNVLAQSAAFGQAIASVEQDQGEDGLKQEAASMTVNAEEFNKLLGVYAKYLDAGDEAAAVNAVAELLVHIVQVQSGHNLLGMERYCMLVMVLLPRLNTTIIQGSTEEQLSHDGFPILHTQGRAVEWRLAERQMTRLTRLLCQQKQEQHKKGEHLLIERIHRFVDGNLGGDLSLARIAEEVYFNPSYLSRYYKQLTGSNLSEYINHAKAEAAGEMLENPKLKIGEVALRLGYESPSYFTAFFRKMTGMSPQEFRDRSFKK